MASAVGHSKSKFKDIQHPPSLLAQDSLLDSPVISRKDVHLPRQQTVHPGFTPPEAFVLEGLLTNEECEFYIKESEKAGMESLEGIFPKEYRSNDRLLTLSIPAAHALFHRILPFLSPIGTSLLPFPPPTISSFLSSPPLPPL